jgi:hypothetical protein
MNDHYPAGWNHLVTALMILLGFPSLLPGAPPDAVSVGENAKLVWLLVLLVVVLIVGVIVGRIGMEIMQVKFRN